MSGNGGQRPPLSYVLAAADANEVHKVAAWLRGTFISPEIEIVLAAPQAAFGAIAAQAIPSRVTIAPAEPRADRKAIRVAGARRTTGLVVIAIDCDEDLATRFRDPFSTERGDSSGLENPAEWADLGDDLLRGDVGTLNEVKPQPKQLPSPPAWAIRDSEGAGLRRHPQTGIEG